MRNTIEQNREQKDYQDRIELKLMLKKAQEGGDYLNGYNCGYEAGKRAAKREIMKEMGQK
jgi:hypothetical protein